MVIEELIFIFIKVTLLLVKGLALSLLGCFIFDGFHTIILVVWLMSILIKKS